jgi:hypothetical protein
MFEPEYPITAEDARSKRVGDRLNLDGTDVLINLVSRSRIYRIEGQGSGRRGRRGHRRLFFNAQGGSTRIVVSWTGENVECYRGMDVSFAMIRKSFNLDTTIAEKFTTSLIRQKQRSSFFKGGTILIWIILVGALGLIAYEIFRPKTPPYTPAFSPAANAPATLKPGATVSMKGFAWQIRRHVLVEIGQVQVRRELQR